ncbi:MAG TPA: HDOD domain-containing protein [Bryobacteraceae bacterium]|jgi:putative nucleotidyltransferase with HDIG domain|nr:HDOD domain-containing protein [Bryobacteraceae bacterium]
MSGQPDPATEAYYRRIAALSLAIEHSARRGTAQEVLEIAEAVNHHFAWEPFANGSETPDPIAAAGLECLRAATLEDLDRAIARLPVFPAVAQRALQMLINNDWSGAELEAIASRDQKIAADLIGAANSWASGPRRRISTISHAISYIGAARAARILYAASIQPLFSSGPLRQLWMHSLAAAQVARTMAETSLSADPNEAFLAGLVHDIGRLAMMMLPAAFQSSFEYLTRAGCEPFLAERILSGFSHAQAGARALKGWSFPEPLVTAIEFHHEPEKTGDRLAAILFLVEHWTDAGEDAPSAARLRIALERAQLKESDLAQLVAHEDRSIDALRYT